MEVLPLGDLVSVKGGKRLPKGLSLQTEKNSHPYIRVRDMGMRYIPSHGLEYVPEDVFNKIQRYIVHENDVLISIVGTVGLISIIDARFNLASQTENSAKLTGLDSSDAHYLYYYLISEMGQSEIRKRTVGAVQPKLPLYNIESLPVNWPRKNIRKMIVNLLRLIDDKIELTRLINQTLEQMAQALFKSWFVDFEPVKAKVAVLEAGGSQEDATFAAMTAISGKDADALAVFEREHPEQYAELKATAELFPSAMQDSELGDIPEGWMVNPTSAHYNISIGKTPPRKEAQWFSTTDGDLKWVSIKDMGIASTYISETSERLTHEAVKKFNIKVMPADTVFLSFKLTVGRICITTEDMCSNEAIAHFTPKGNKYKSHWLYHALNSFDFNKLGSTSSIATAVNSKTIRDMKLIFPNELISQRYTEKVSSLMQLQKLNAGQINSLTQLRDTLLPKLLSGEITLPEAEQAVSEAENV